MDSNERVKHCPWARSLLPCSHCIHTCAHQVVESSRKEGGLWLRFVMARLVALRYQTRLGVIEAGGQASRLAATTGWFCRNNYWLIEPATYFPPTYPCPVPPWFMLAVRAIGPSCSLLPLPFPFPARCTTASAAAAPAGRSSGPVPYPYLGCEAGGAAAGPPRTHPRHM